MSDGTGANANSPAPANVFGNEEQVNFEWDDVFGAGDDASWSQNNQPVFELLPENEWLPLNDSPSPGGIFFDDLPAPDAPLRGTPPSIFDASPVREEEEDDNRAAVIDPYRFQLLDEEEEVDFPEDLVSDAGGSAGGSAGAPPVPPPHRRRRGQSLQAEAASSAPFGSDPALRGPRHNLVPCTSYLLDETWVTHLLQQPQMAGASPNAQRLPPPPLRLSGDESTTSWTLRMSGTAADDGRTPLPPDTFRVQSRDDASVRRLRASWSVHRYASDKEDDVQTTNETAIINALAEWSRCFGITPHIPPVLEAEQNDAVEGTAGLRCAFGPAGLSLDEWASDPLTTEEMRRSVAFQLVWTVLSLHGTGMAGLPLAAPHVRVARLSGNDAQAPPLVVYRISHENGFAVPTRDAHLMLEGDWSVVRQCDDALLLGSDMAVWNFRRERGDDTWWIPEKGLSAAQESKNRAEQAERAAWERLEKAKANLAQAKDKEEEKRDAVLASERNERPSTLNARRQAESLLRKQQASWEKSKEAKKRAERERKEAKADHDVASSRLEKASAALRKASERAGSRFVWLQERTYVLPRLPNHHSAAPGRVGDSERFRAALLSVLATLQREIESAGVAEWRELVQIDRDNLNLLLDTLTMPRLPALPAVPVGSPTRDLEAALAVVKKYRPFAPFRRLVLPPLRRKEVDRQRMDVYHLDMEGRREPGPAHLFRYVFPRLTDRLRAIEQDYWRSDDVHSLNARRSVLSASVARDTANPSRWTISVLERQETADVVRRIGSFRAGEQQWTEERHRDLLAECVRKSPPTTDAKPFVLQLELEENVAVQDEDNGAPAALQAPEKLLLRLEMERPVYLARALCEGLVPYFSWWWWYQAMNDMTADDPDLPPPVPARRA